MSEQNEELRGDLLRSIITKRRVCGEEKFDNIFREPVQVIFGFAKRNLTEKRSEKEGEMITFFEKCH